MTASEGFTCSLRRIDSDMQGCRFERTNEHVLCTTAGKQILQSRAQTRSSQSAAHGALTLTASTQLAWHAGREHHELRNFAGALEELRKAGAPKDDHLAGRVGCCPRLQHRRTGALANSARSKTQSAVA